MKKRIVFITIFFIIGLIIIFNIPLPKKTWSKNLINDYIIKKDSETSIYLLNKDKVIINDYIAEYSYGKKYILLKCLENSNNLTIKFYIIDTINNQVFGPFLDYQEFTKKQEEIIDETMNEYIKTIN